MDMERQAHDFWAMMKSSLLNQKVKIVTVMRTQRPGSPFIASIDEDAILIQPEHAKYSIKLKEDEFCEIFPHYFAWLNGTERRYDIAQRSRKTSYIFGLITHFLVSALSTTLKSLISNTDVLSHLVDKVFAALPQFVESSQDILLCNPELTETADGHKLVCPRCFHRKSEDSTNDFVLGFVDEDDGPSIYLRFPAALANALQNKLKNSSFSDIKLSGQWLRLNVGKAWNMLPNWIKILISKVGLELLQQLLGNIDHPVVKWLEELIGMLLQYIP